MTVSNNRKNFMQDVDFRKSMEYTKEIKLLVHSKFNEAKIKLLSEFNNHPITKEIEAGVDSLNTSGTLGGVGNLFSFIGFEANSKPTMPIRKAFEAIKLTSIMIKKDGTSQSYVVYPSPDDIFQITPLPWAEGRSWSKAMETGLSGLGYYLNKSSNNSRSGKGIQLDSSHQIRAGKFKNIQYISKLIRDFEVEVNKFRFLSI